MRRFAFALSLILGTLSLGYCQAQDEDKPVGVSPVPMSDSGYHK